MHQLLVSQPHIMRDLLSQQRPCLIKMSADVQTFSDISRFIRAAQPIDVTENEVLSMVSAKHFRKRDIMSYDAR